MAFPVTAVNWDMAQVEGQKALASMIIWETSVILAAKSALDMKDARTARQAAEF